MKKKILGYILVSLLLILCLSVCADYLGWGGNAVQVSVPQGSGATEIVQLLKENKVITHPRIFLQYIKEEALHLKAGVHAFTKGMGYAEVLEELKRDVPLENMRTVTIPEGYEVREIAALLEGAGIVQAADFLEACQRAHRDFSFLPKDGNVEGYLFPATYSFLPDSDASLVAGAMFDAFQDKMFTKENIFRAKELSMTFHEALTLASIIEREAAKAEESALVSSVFHNRLKQNMRLESCATVQYILKERKDVLSVADTKIISPYNTYQNAGLPPSPISSPGESSLSAALYPADTPYLFFVADGNGGHTFSQTYEEHISAAGITGR